jgi:hypothetical protein
MLETAIILLNGRHYNGEYSIVFDVHSVVYQDNQNMTSIKQLLIDLSHANYLTGNKISYDLDYNSYSSHFSLLNKKVNAICEFLIDLQKNPEKILKTNSHADSDSLQQLSFKRFLSAYQRDYNHSGLFKSSHFLDKVENKQINNMQDVKSYAAQNPQSRTSYLLKFHPEHSSDIKFLRFLNRFQNAFLTPGYFKQSHFKKLVATGEINSMEKVKQYASDNPSSRTTKVLKTFR